LSGSWQATLARVIKARTKLITFELLGGICNLIWIGASVVFLYFLYGALAKDTPWPYLGWSLVAVFIAKQIAASLKDNKRRIDYVDQLTERGYEQADGEAAWRTAADGGTNLLRNLQQAELVEEIDRLETAINTSNGEEDSA